MIKGKLVVLRELRHEDADPLRKLINDEEVLYFMRQDVPFPFTEKDEEDFIAQISASKDCYAFGIESLRTGELIGCCGTNRVSWKNRWAEIGIFIGAKDLWGHGYGTDAIRLLLRFLFEEMNLNRVSIEVYAFNTRAITAYEKCGFVHEGTQRQHVFKRGSYHDTQVMSILRDEYFNAERSV